MKRRTGMLALVLAATALAGGFTRAAEPLKVGVFAVDASPPIGSPLAYDPTEKVALALSCRGVVLIGDGKPVVLCAVDWIGIANGGQTEFRKALAEAAGTEPGRVVVHTLHQHDAPNCDFTSARMMAEHGADVSNVFDVEFERDVIARAASAVREATAKARAITHLGLGEAKVEQVASNRRVLGPDGKVEHVRFTACKDPDVRAKPIGTIDPLLKMISFWGGDKPVAVLTYYATHPQSNYLTRAANPDFPGIARNLRESFTGVPHVHFDGAGGNVGAGKFNDGDPENRQVLADRVADGMARAWQATKRHPISAGELGWDSVDVVLPPAPHLDETELLAQLDDDSLAPAPGRRRPRPDLAPPLPARRSDRRDLPDARPSPCAPHAGRVVRRVPARRPETAPRPVRRDGCLRRLCPRLHRHRGRVLPGRLRDEPEGVVGRPGCRSRADGRDRDVAEGLTQ